MNKEDTDTEQPRLRWFIDLDWFPRNNRSFATLARDRLCPACRERLEAEATEVTDSQLIATIRDCCAKTPGFISSELPILESVFRLFLVTGNQPLDLEQLSQQLDEQLGGDSYRTSPDILSRLLGSDRYYGLRQFQE